MCTANFQRHCSHHSAAQVTSTAPSSIDGSAQLAFPRPTPGQALLLYVAQSLSLSPLRYHQTHYQRGAFTDTAHTVPGLFEELLLLLQPLALLPFSLDLLFQHRLLQSGQQLWLLQGIAASVPGTCYCPPTRPCSWPSLRGRADPGDVDRGPWRRVKGVGAPRGGEEEEEEGRQRAAGSSGRSRWTKWAGWLVVPAHA